jgi:BirA family biotin operon repressor/biotin-[acetyl-CoA-carboxylase] ligase
VGGTLLIFTEIDSTNEEIWRLVGRDEACHGLVAVAETQTAGRGRRENTWHSPPGSGLWFSVLLSLDLPGGRIACLTQVVGVQISLALEPFLDPTVRVKWPNDLHLCGLKVGGILTEARSQDGNPTLVVVGVGLNVNQGREDFPPDIAGTATSLRLHGPGPLDRARVLDAILDRLQEGTQALAVDDLGDLERTLVERSAVFGKRVRVRGHGGTVEGTVVEQSLVRGLVLSTGGGERVEVSNESIQSLDLLE